MINTHKEIVRTDEMVQAARCAKKGEPMPDGFTIIHTGTVLWEGWELDNTLLLLGLGVSCLALN